MELPARQVYSPASSADTFRRYRTSTSELLMSAVWGWGHTQGSQQGLGPYHGQEGSWGPPPTPTPHGRAVGFRSCWGPDLQDLHVGEAVGPETAAIDDDVLQPLDVGLGVAVHLAQQLHVAACHGCRVGREPRLQDGPVRGPLWGPGQAVNPDRWYPRKHPGHLPPAFPPPQLKGGNFPDTQLRPCLPPAYPAETFHSSLLPLGSRTTSESSFQNPPRRGSPLRYHTPGTHLLTNALCSLHLGPLFSLGSLPGCLSHFFSQLTPVPPGQHHPPPPPRASRPPTGTPRAV